MSTIQISDSLHDRLSNWAAQRGESVEAFTEEILEEYLEDLEEQAAMDRMVERIKAGKEERISWEQFQAIDDPEERYDILAVLVAEDAIQSGEDRFYSLEEVKAELGVSG
ncbi:MAG: hypothetical protein M3220_11285 [Chloroflexota bacterium]|nr:hypothetical protein [Chloroflexota bacterium]